MKEAGKLMMIGGGLLLVAGLVCRLAGDRLKWLGRLPGDIRIERPGFSFYMPVVTMILVSILLSAVWWFIQKFLK